MTMYKDVGKGAVIMINSGSGGSMLREIERAIAHEYDWPDGLTADKQAVKLSPEHLDACVGEYTARNGFQCTIAKDDDNLLLKFGGQTPIELHPESETKFFATVLNLEVTFERTDKGDVKSINFQQDGRTISAERKP